MIFIFVIICSTLITFTKTQKDCPGTSGSFYQHNFTLTFYQKLYTGCTHIKGNLEIIGLFVSNEDDLSFLESIQEVTGYVLYKDGNIPNLGLKNLHVIRGESLYDAGENIFLSLSVSNNLYGLKSLGLKSLVEIVNGDVMFYKNPYLCNEDTILWEDIFKNDNSKVIFDSVPKYATCESCSSMCKPLANKTYCWNNLEDSCQIMTKVVCKESCGGRCLIDDRNMCCMPDCVGGCTGSGREHCFACEKFSDNGKCVDSCPPERIYDNIKYQWIPNPDVKYAYGNKCVKECPAHLFMDKNACVKSCSEGHVAINNKCEPCEGVCPKNCNGTGKNFLNTMNIDEFVGCTTVDGHIIINGLTFEGDPIGTQGLKFEDLSKLNDILEIHDYLYIDAKTHGLKNLSFLQKLHTIRGRNLHKGNSLVIYGTQIEVLGLHSLKHVLNGKILIKNNVQLCYVDPSVFDWSKLLTKNTVKNFDIRENKNITLCEEEGNVCSKSCTPDGCWNAGNNMCLSCMAYKQDTTCVEACDLTHFYINENGKQCIPCHEQCLDGCTDQGADHCIKCLNFKNGPFCEASCPPVKYPGADGNCEPCKPNCVDGCTGPNDGEGPGACNKCAIKIKDFNGEESCLPPDSQCPDDYYLDRRIKWISSQEKIITQVCKLCDYECDKCSGPGNSHCEACRHVYEEGRCLPKCSLSYYLASTPDLQECFACNHLCSKCIGPTMVDCLDCRVARVYRNFETRDQEKQFNCTDECPEWAPNKIQDTIEGRKVPICVPDAFANYSENSKKSSVGLIVGLIFATLLLLAVLFLIIFVLRQKKRLKDKKLKDDDESLDEPLKSPDTSVLRIIQETELERNEVIGSGAFGTVYKGCWRPNGENIKIPVAIKIMSEGTTASQNKEMLDEARIMASVNHPCCVRVLAICMTSSMQLVSPLMPFGSLVEYIRKNKDHIGSQVLLNWAKQIAEGMNYLEGLGIVHRDLAARNVLVKNAKQVKITDFGLSKLLDVNEVEYKAGEGKLPIKWMAIESVRHRIFTHKSDVWSYGVTIWELFTYGDRPYDGVPAYEVLDLLDRGERLSQPRICTIDVYMMMIKCWMVDSDSRPTFLELVESFKKMSRDPGRYLVIKGDEYMKLSTKYYDTKDLIDSDGPEKIMSADEYFSDKNQNNSSDNYLEPRNKENLKNEALEEAIKGKKDKKKQRQPTESRYTSDPFESDKKSLQPLDDLDKTIDVQDYLDIEKQKALIDQDKETQKKSRFTPSEYLRMNRESSEIRPYKTKSEVPAKTERNTPSKQSTVPESRKTTLTDDDYLMGMVSPEVPDSEFRPLIKTPQGSVYYNTDTTMSHKNKNRTYNESEI